MIMVEYDPNISQPSSHYQPTRDTHYPHLEHRHSAPSTPSPPYHYAHLSSYTQQQHQPASVRSTPTSYPSPAPYESPSMAAYHHVPQQVHNSPRFQPMSVPSYSLPPIRMTPPNTSLPPPVPPQVGSPLPPPPHIYYGHGLQNSISHITSSPQPLRYPLPQVTPERIMSGGRHKKEIKRRTKTGCLTCRKRRIKCDEAHPTCKNCAKSKRECMGYDPIFKPQPGPTAIQPAPSSGGSAPPPVASTPIPYTGSNPSLGGLVYTQTVSTASSSPASSYEPYEYTAIDPSLESSVPIGTHAPPMLADTAAAPRIDLKRTYDHVSPSSCLSDTPRASATPIGRSLTPNPSTLRDSSATNPAKRIKIDDLLSGGANGHPLTPPSGDQLIQTLTTPGHIEMYRKKFAPRLDALLETNWFQTRGVQKVIRGGPFGEQLGGLFTRLNGRGGLYIDEEDSALENTGGDAEVILNAVKLVYGTRVPAKSTTEQDDDYAEKADIINRNETLNRIEVVEALVTGKTAILELCAPHISPKGAPALYDDSHNGAGTSFWRSLAKFVLLQEGKDHELEFNTILDSMKHNLGGIWVREVLYNIAEARHLHNRLRSQELAEPELLEEKRKVQVCFEKAKNVVLGMARASTYAQVDAEAGTILRRVSARAAVLLGFSNSDQFVL
ncbi:hypothetical protein BDZ91DRAFT_789058 [Kalaharituber pfeilii]|nr:hypothetical protein BDZ91DRAFT_789058 [Kalaharituber pfeilii]